MPEICWAVAGDIPYLLYLLWRGGTAPKRWATDAASCPWPFQTAGCARAQHRYPRRQECSLREICCGQFRLLCIGTSYCQFPKCTRCLHLCHTRRERLPIDRCRRGWKRRGRFVQVLRRHFVQREVCILLHRNGLLLSGAKYNERSLETTEASTPCL